MPFIQRITRLREKRARRPRWFDIDDLIAEPEGPSFISSTVAQRRVNRRCS
jgi:hypothetical protein